MANRSDYEQLLAAIKAIKVDKKRVNSSAKAHGIDRKTLDRYVAKFNAEVPDISAVSDAKLLKIVQRIRSHAETALVHLDIFIILIK